MDFYTTLTIGTIIFTIFTLIFVGYYMSLSRKNEVYPPSIADCPDYYYLDSAGLCNAGSGIGSAVASNPECNKFDFNDHMYTIKGTDMSSGLCSKKIWANKCEVSWDGITNDDNLCYTPTPS
jgi:hypothetical protein